MSAPIIKPLHTDVVGGHPLRFFCSPLADGRPDLPWHCVDDLQRCLGLNRDERRFFMRSLRTGSWGSMLRTVATADGLVTIAPHFMAQGTIDAMVAKGQAPACARTEYDQAGAEAMHKIVVPFVFPSDGWLVWMRAAMNRWENPNEPQRAAP